MKNIRRKVQEVIHSEGHEGFNSLAWLLYASSVGYGVALKIRQKCFQQAWRKPRKLTCKVISIGNLTAGGTGKTPTTLRVARIVRQMGYHAVIISRGYKGTAEAAGGIVSDGQTMLMKVRAAGDEPFMMAQQLKDIPVVIGKNRFATGLRSVQKFEPDVIILDDAFQHRQLARDIDIVLLDARHPFGNGYLLPRGPLRESPSALARGDAFVMMQSNSGPSKPAAAEAAQIKSLAGEKPVFQAVRIPQIRDIVTCHAKADKPRDQAALLSCSKVLRDQKVYAFCGLASNTGFRRTLEGFGCQIIGFAEFADHHWYSQREIKTIFNAAQVAHADMVVTTDKDYVRMSRWGKGEVDLVVMGLEVRFEPDASFRDFISKKMAN